MSKVRPPYPAEFRQQMVELVRAGRSPAQLSREFGVTAQSITNWVGQAAIDDGKPLPGKEGLTTAEREELLRLRRQLRLGERRDKGRLMGALDGLNRRYGRVTVLLGRRRSQALGDETGAAHAAVHNAMGRHACGADVKYSQ